MEKIIRELENDLSLFLKGQAPRLLRGAMKDDIDLRAARLIIFSLQWASVGYQSVLRFAGAKLGQAVGSHFESQELSLILGDLKKIIEGLKWGKVELKTDPQKKLCALKLIDSLTSVRVPNINQNLCFFEEGFIEGCLDGIIKNRGALTLFGLEESVIKINVRETKCVGKGDDFCEFTITLGS